MYATRCWRRTCSLRRSKTSCLNSAFTGRRPPLHLDPPEHTPYRRALNPLLKPERIAILEPVIRKTASDLLKPLVAAGSCDVCTDYSSHLTIRVFAEWMNVPEEMVVDLQHIGRAYNIAVQSADGQMVRETSLKLYDMARAMIDQRRQHPLDPATDPTTALLAARVDGEPFPDDMILGTIRQVLVVGIIAPTIVVGSIAVHLARDTQLQTTLREDLTLMPKAIEEFLRLYTPYRGFARTANRDVSINGREIARRRADRASVRLGQSRRSRFQGCRSVCFGSPEYFRAPRLRHGTARVRRRSARAPTAARGNRRASQMRAAFRARRRACADSIP